MTPAKLDLRLYRGDTYRWAYRLWADSAHILPLDLSDAIVESQIREKAAGAIIVNLDVSTAVDVDSAVEQIVIIDLKTAHWEGDPAIPTRGAWDLQLTDTEGNVLTPVAGIVDVTLDVTDSTP